MKKILMLLVVFVGLLSCSVFAATNDSETLGLWHMDTTVVVGSDTYVPDDDAGGTRDNDLLLQNGAALSATPGFDGTGFALQLDGVDDHASIGWDSNDTFKFEAAFKLDALTGAHQYIAAIGSVVRLYVHSATNKIQLTLWDDAGVAINKSTSGDPLVPGQWYTVEASYDSTGAYKAIVKDASGTQVGATSGVSGTGVLNSSGGIVAIGAGKNGAGDYFGGVIDEVKLSAFAPPPVELEDDPYTIALYHCDSDYIDAGDKLWTPDANTDRGEDLELSNGAALDPNGIGYIDHSLVLDGVDDHASIGWDGYGSFKFEAAFKLDALTGVNQYITDIGGVVRLYVRADGSIHLTLWDDTSTPINKNGGGSINADQWYTVEASYDSTGAYKAIVKDAFGGQVSGTQGVSGTGVLNSSGGIVAIGAGKNGGSSYFGGMLDEIKISVPDLDLDCGAWGYLEGDLNMDCYVDIDDLSILALEWLETTDPAADDDAVQGSYDQYQTYNIPKTTSAPTIDGTIDAGEWADAKVVSIVYPDNVTPPNVGSQKYDEPISPADFSANYHYKWDDTYLYVGIQVFDDVLLFGNGYPDDHVTLAVNPLQAGTEFADVAFYEMFIDPNDNPSAANNAGANPAFDSVNAIMAASKQDGGLFTTGWSFEVAYKWSDFDGYAPTTGDSHGFAVLMCDQDDSLGSDRDTFLTDAPAGIPGDPSLYRVVTLVNDLECGDFGYVDGDVNGDCQANMIDFTAVAEGWLSCTDPDGIDCFIVE